MQVEKILSRIKSHPLMVLVMALSALVIALSSFTDAARNLFDALTPKGPESARAELSKISMPYTPEAFVAAVDNGDTAAVNLFLAAGMSPDAANSKGETGLMLAVEKQSSAIVAVLLAAKANVNAKDQTGATALMRAATKADSSIVDTLLKAGANVHERDLYEDTALSWAAASGSKDAVIKLLALDAKSDDINRAFIAAARARENNVLRALLDRGVDLKTAGPQALIKVVERDNINDEASDTVGLLLDAGVDIDGKNEQGANALFLAAQEGNMTLVKVLLERGADVNVVCDCDGFYSVRNWTPLHIAVFRGHNEVMQALLAKGADVNAKCDEGETALMFAAENGNTDSVRALLQRGARVSEKDVNGKTALDYAGRVANQKSRAEILGLLKKAGA